MMTMLHIISYINLLITIKKSTGFPAPEVPQISQWESLNALTLATRDMDQSVLFYQKLGLKITFGGPNQPFTTLSPKGSYNKRESLYINLFYSEDYEPPATKSWGRCVIHVSDVDAMYTIATQEGLRAEFPPRDAPWGERYFHLHDPMGHELSFAKRIDDHPRWDRDTLA